jgi:hypothetical protein
MKRSRGTIYLLLILLGSISLNLVLLLDRSFGSAPDGEGRSDAPPADADARRQEVDPVCRAKLKRCQQEELDLLVGAIGRPTAAPTASPASQPRPKEGSSPGSRAPGLVHAEVDLELQQSVLCDVAKRKLRRLWHKKRDQIVKNVTHTLGDRAKQRRDTEQEARRFAQVLGLNDGQRLALQREYEGLRGKQLSALRNELMTDPPRLDAAFQHARGLFAGEDRLVERLFGGKARTQLRASQLEKRTVVLALIAALAGKPWDQTIGW